MIKTGDRKERPRSSGLSPYPKLSVGWPERNRSRGISVVENSLFFERIEVVDETVVGEVLLFRMTQIHLILSVIQASVAEGNHLSLELSLGHLLCELVIRNRLRGVEVISSAFLGVEYDLLLFFNAMTLSHYYKCFLHSYTNFLPFLEFDSAGFPP